jgi:hypothetical protein
MNVKYYDKRDNKVKNAFTPREDSNRIPMAGSRLFDKTGKEIHEGHIVARTHSDNRFIHFTHAIRIEQGQFVYSSEIEGDRYWPLKDYALKHLKQDQLNCYIIGCVHQNPELVHQTLNQDQIDQLLGQTAKP